MKMREKDNNIFQVIISNIKWFFYEIFRYALLFLSKIFKIDLNKVKSEKKRIIEKYIFVCAILILPLINFALFYVYCNLSQVFLAFEEKLPNGTTTFSFNNFVAVFENFTKNDGTLLLALKNTLIFFVLSNFIMFPLAIFWSYTMRKKIFGTSFFRVIFYLPSILSSVALTAIIRYMIGTDGPIGIYYRVLAGLNYTPSFFSENEYALKCLLIYAFYMGFGGNIILLSGAMSKVPDELLEASSLDGITIKDELFKIVIPLCWPTFSTMIIIAMTGLFGSSGEVILFTQGKGNTTTISYWLFDQVKNWNSYNVPSAFGVILTLILYPLVCLVRFLCNKVYADVEF